MPSCHFLSQFSVSKRFLKTFFDNFNFKTLYPLKFCPFFEDSTWLFTRYNNILWICWFFAKNKLTIFVFLCLKLDNPYCHISAYAAPLLEERLICLKSVKISYLAKEKSSSLTTACRGSRQHFWQNDKIVAIRTMGFVILFPTLLWKECVLSYLLKMAKSRKVFASLLK